MVGGCRLGAGRARAVGGKFFGAIYPGRYNNRRRYSQPVFAIHVFIMPAIIFVFIGLHLLLVLRHGIAEPPVAGKPVDPQTYRQEYHELLQKTGHPFWPEGAWRDFVFGTALIVVIALLAFFVGPPPLDKPPDLSILKADPRPDWYLLWYFALLALIPPQMESYVMVLTPAVIGILLLAVPLLNNRGERAPSRRPWAIAVVLLSVIMIGSLWIAGARAPWSPNFDSRPLPEKIVGATSGPVFEGSKLFRQKGCLNCHLIDRVTAGGAVPISRMLATNFQKATW